MNSAFLYLLSIACFDYLSIGLVYPIFSSLLFSEGNAHSLDSSLSYGDRGAILGLLLGMAPFIQFIISPWVGKRSDQHGRKPLLLITLATGVIGYFLGGVCLLGQISLTGLILSRILIGISCANSSVVNAAFSDISDETTRARSFTWLCSAYGIGFTIGPFLGGFLHHPPEWLGNILPYFSGNDPSRPFFIAGFALLVGVVLLWRNFSETVVKENRLNIQGDGGKRSLYDVLNIKVILFLASTFLFCFGWSFYWEIISTSWVHIEKANVEDVGNRYAYGALSYTIFALSAVQYLTLKIPYRIIFVGGSLLLSGSIFAVSYFSDPKHLIWLIPFQQFGIALLYPSALANIAACGQSNQQGTIMGLHTAMVSLGFAISPFSAGPFLSLSPYAPIFVGSVSIFISVVVFVIALCLPSSVQEHTAAS